MATAGTRSHRERVATLRDGADEAIAAWLKAAKSRRPPKTKLPRLERDAANAVQALVTHLDPATDLASFFKELSDMVRTLRDNLGLMQGELLFAFLMVGSWWVLGTRYLDSAPPLGAPDAIRDAAQHVASLLDHPGAKITDPTDRYVKYRLRRATGGGQKSCSLGYVAQPDVARPPVGRETDIEERAFEVLRVLVSHRQLHPTAPAREMERHAIRSAELCDKMSVLCGRTVRQEEASRSLRALRECLKGMQIESVIGGVDLKKGIYLRPVASSFEVDDRSGPESI